MSDPLEAFEIERADFAKVVAGIRKIRAASLEELRSVCQESDVKFVACQMTVDLFDFEKSDFIDGIEYGGAATFMKFAGESDVCLFI